MILHSSASFTNSKSPAVSGHDLSALDDPVLDLKISEWKSTGSSGLRERQLSFMLALNYAIGPKQTLATEKQVEVIPAQPGRLYIVEGSVQTPKFADVPDSSSSPAPGFHTGSSSTLSRDIASHTSHRARPV